MGFFGDMSCKIGLHSWSDWFYQTAGNCTQIRKCNRCSKVSDEKRTEHTFAEWNYPEEGSCLNVRVCTRCGHEESRTLHPEHEWEYKHENDCEQQRACPRCAEPSQRTEHVWDSWHYEAPKTCDQLRICARCHERELRPAREDKDHEQWSEWDYASNLSCSIFQRHCLRCSKQETDTRLPKHQYTEWQQTSRTMKERQCIRCHHSDHEFLKDTR